ncbi:hypothetical protein H7H78_06560 [Mycobacterium shinjukuense]|uniref:Uncharacterized protein n=1 Tax=Mycobacterium shinjukuense TaxID=398694 RepID=A0A7I7MS62_9MYCO|nr:hypothetical protein [Mycobacterium shinjukuense]MCV6985123.1 hypothetical protein [Mycobacterium shinjukuense]ORB70740.1 hypothetical protein BST45_04915 [Mycobacterium shinjukuense]BBX75088.1 hypothetical protein MSHI_29940 [Mycobacterium shinjukuense]
MRAVVTVVLWWFTTVALAVAIPAAWAQTNIVDEDGYATLARKAAGDPALQSAMASELATRAMALITDRHGPRYPIDSSAVHAAAAAFTAGPSFPPLFAQVNRAAHAWLFSASPPGGTGAQWLVDLAPLLNDDSLRQMLSGYQVQAPATLTVPLTVSAPQPLRPGQLRQVGVWGPWVSIGAAAVAGVCGLLTLVATRRRGRALTSLGVSALLVGAGGWAVIEVGGRYVDDALNHTAGDIRRMADVLVGHAEDGMHLWLSLTLVAGAALVMLGVLVAALGSLVSVRGRGGRTS